MLGENGDAEKDGTEKGVIVEEEQVEQIREEVREERESESEETKEETREERRQERREMDEVRRGRERRLTVTDGRR